MTEETLDSNANFVTSFARVLAELLKQQYSLRFGDVSAEQLRSEVQAAIDSLLPHRVTLSTARPDYDSVLVQMMREIERGQAWKDTTLSSTGQMILRLLAADVDFAQFSIMRALQEAFPHTARNPTSIIAAARGHGIRIQRNTPASFDARFQRQDQLGAFTVPAWTLFSVEGVTDAFNREQIIFAANQLEATVKLFVGTVREVTVRSTGVPLQIVEIGEETFNISDRDLRVLVNGVEWRRSEASIWNAQPNEKLFWENTLPNGNVEVRFGDGTWGASPPPGVPITVRWVETSGSEGNDSRSGLEVRWRDIRATPFRIETVSPALQGNDRLSINYYRTFSGDRRGADGGNQKRAVLRKDFRAHAATYPGVFDAVYRGQAELAPRRRSWMNVLGVTLLTEPVFTDLQWQQFVEFMKGGGQYEGLMLDNLELLRMDPSFDLLDIRARVACRLNADLSRVKARLIANLTQATSPRIGSLGFNFYKSDIYDLLTGLPPGRLFDDLDPPDQEQQTLSSLIEYVVLEEPVTDMVLDSPLRWVKLGTVSLDVHYSRERRAGFEGKDYVSSEVGID